MTIGSSNVSFSSIASEKGITNSNLSLQSLSGKDVKTNLADGTSSSSSFGLVKHTMSFGGLNSSRSAGTVTSAQGTGSAGLNTASYSLSEWVGYDPVPNWIMGTTGTSAVIHGESNYSSSSCIIPVNHGLRIWCTKSGSTISIYGGTKLGTSTVRTYRNNTSTSSTNADTLLGTITTNTSGMIPTGCSMSYTTLQSANTGTFFGTGGSVSTVNGGSSSSINLGATKIGYRVDMVATSEGAGGGTGTSNFCVGVRFNWTFPTSPSGLSYNSSYTQIAVHLESNVTHTGSFFSC